MPQLRFDAFISHAGKDTAQAEIIEAGLGATRVWLDRSEITLGALLGRELLSNIRASRALVLLWSKRAARSPWVQSEWIAAANLGKPIVPIRLDQTPLPQALTNTLWRRGRASLKASVAELARTIRGGLSRGPSISPSMRLPNPRLEAEDHAPRARTTHHVRTTSTPATGQSPPRPAAPRDTDDGARPETPARPSRSYAMGVQREEQRHA